MKYNQKISVIKKYFRNGNEDDAKFVEIDGAKFEADDADATKPKLDDKGEKIPFKDQAGGGDGGTGADNAGTSLEELAKTNPEVAKLLDDKKKLEDDATKAADEARKKAETDAEKNGEWQKLADERGKKVDELTETVNKKDEILGKYVGSVKSILAEVKATIPKENQGLVPENFSPREQLEYITKNAKLLGAKIVGAKGGAVDNNEADAPTDEEGKIIAEIEELRKKDVKTNSDHTQIFDLSKKLKEIRANKK